jgi:hypothetical protein
MKTLVFSTKVTLDGLPAGFSGTFKMLDMETGELYVYRVHIPKHIYVGSHVAGRGTKEDDWKWWESMFYALTVFLEAYYVAYGCLPSDNNIYQDRRSYTSEQQPLGIKIVFMVERCKRRSMEDRELVLQTSRNQHLQIQK